MLNSGLECLRLELYDWDNVNETESARAFFPEICVEYAAVARQRLKLRSLSLGLKILLPSKACLSGLTELSHLQNLSFDSEYTYYGYGVQATFQKPKTLN